MCTVVFVCFVLAVYFILADTATHKDQRVNSGGFLAGERDVGQDGIQHVVMCLQVALVCLVSLIWIELPRQNHLLFWIRSMSCREKGPDSPVLWLNRYSNPSSSSAGARKFSSTVSPNSCVTRV